MGNKDSRPSRKQSSSESREREIADIIAAANAGAQAEAARLAAAAAVATLEPVPSKHAMSNKPLSSSSSHHHKDCNRERDRGGDMHDEPSGSVPSRSPDVLREGEDGDGEDVEMVMSVEQVMDLGSDSEDGDHEHGHGPADDGNVDMEMDMQQSSDDMDHDPSPTEGVSSRIHPPASVSVTPITPPQQQTLDPRLKHRSEESGWDPDTIRVANGLNEVHV